MSHSAANPDLRCGGFYLGHPADGTMPLAIASAAANRLLHRLAGQGSFAPPATFLRLDAALEFAAGHHRPTEFVHGIWLSEPRARAMLRQEARGQAAATSGVLRSLRAGCGATVLPACEAAGWDVLGFAGDSCWPWQQEPAACEVLRQIGATTAAHDLLPTASLARTIRRTLEADVLGAPVLWRSWQRTVHAVRR